MRAPLRLVSPSSRTRTTRPTSFHRYKKTHEEDAINKLVQTAFSPNNSRQLQYAETFFSQDNPGGGQDVKGKFMDFFPEECSILRTKKL